jgi:hypothetical protein
MVQASVGMVYTTMVLADYVHLVLPVLGSLDPGALPWIPTLAFMILVKPLC